MQAGPAGVDVEFRRDAIEGTSRATVAFRLILAIPHLIALWALSYAAAAVAIVAWFAVLFTACVPDGLYNFIGWVVRYGARVWAYVWLMNDRWPSFSESPDDPVRVQLPGPERLNRAAVFFRVILAIPAAIVASLLSSGLAVAGILLWLVVLIRGRVPQPVFDATGSVVRYQTRFYGYLALLAARYPSGAYGDPGDPTEPAAAPADAAVPPLINRPAKRLVVVFIVLGVLGLIAQLAVSAAIGRKAVDRQAADNRLKGAYQSLQLSDATSCLAVSDQIGCATKAAQQNADLLRVFKADVDSIDFPGDVADDVHALKRSTDRFIADFATLSKATSLQDYANIATSTNISLDGKAFDDAVRQLSDNLENNGP